MKPWDVLAILMYGLVAALAALAAERTNTLDVIFWGTFGVGALGAALAGATLSFFSVGVLFVVLAVLPASAAALSLVLRRSLLVSAR